ncbi:response regulator transcription factor [Luteolibacter yonseiensis]|uniref:Response regulator transcription factor n=1 Tax=Luteolibacter yonseiensis TaxID=1144680 RepID=A0A934R2N8_9BACT|nr:response regulator transcription factor [Luteolibacter yonseiensis]MBK1814395.1 response regulator transcription factor [Luteolibacter yonseiensis]
MDQSVKRVFLVDDHPMVRELLALMIDQQPDLQVCGEASDASQAIEGIGNTQPDIAVVDLSLKSSSGLELIKDIKARKWGTPVLVLSMHDEGLYAERVLRAGGFGYINKQENSNEILHAIRKVIDRQIYVSEKLAGIMLKRIAKGNGSEISPVESLADRELEIFQMIGRGNSTRSISETLGLSIKTVESYRARIKEKLQLEDGVQLMQQAVLWVRSYDDR